MGLESENVDTMWHRDRQLVSIVVVIRAIFPLCFIFRSILKLEWISASGPPCTLQSL